MKRDYWNHRYAGQELVWSAEPNRFLVAECASLPPGRALDLACGEGRNALWLAERGWQVRGLDFSEVAIEKARRIADHRGVTIDFEVADLLTTPLARDAFDLVLLMYLQLPGNEMESVVRRAAGAVAPGGTLLLVGHDRTNRLHGHGGPQDDSVLYTPDEVVTWLPGLSVVRAERVLREVDDAERPAIDALVRATRPAQR